MVKRVCEFDPEIITTIVQLTKRLRLAKEADITGGTVDAMASKFQQLKEKIAAGADAEHIFNTLDEDGSG
jgi:hypothetical protein